tara:strand:- start:2667 stop:2990 length:324 start_codon:yes stop_codon:yes gene_type:complete
MEKIKKGDSVQVITGKEKGKIGIVLESLDKGNYYIIEGVNMQTKTKKRNPQTGDEGGFVKKEARIHRSNVAFYDVGAKKHAKIGIRVLPDGNKIRYNKASNETVEKQ